MSRKYEEQSRFGRAEAWRQDFGDRVAKSAAIIVRQRGTKIDDIFANMKPMGHKVTGGASPIGKASLVQTKRSWIQVIPTPLPEAPFGSVIKVSDIYRLTF